MSSDLMSQLEFITKLSTCFYDGFGLYCSVVEVPAMLECGTKGAANHWNGMFKRAAKYQSILVLIGLFSSLASYYFSKESKFLYCAMLLAIIPVYTIFGMMPTNYKLMDPANDKSSKETQYLLEKWEKLHAVRSIIGFVATCILLY